jgi:hypothetical protein
MAQSIEWLKKQRERDAEEAKEIAERQRIRAASIRQAIKEGRRELRASIGRMAEAHGFIVVIDEVPTLAIPPEQLAQVFARAAKKYGLAASGVASEDAEEPAAAVAALHNGTQEGRA